MLRQEQIAEMLLMRIGPQKDENISKNATTREEQQSFGNAILTLLLRSKGNLKHALFAAIYAQETT